MTSTSNATSGLDAVDEKPVSMRVVDRVAEVTGTDPLEIEPLYGIVDPDNLDGLFETNGETAAQRRAEVRFQMEGCDVVVEGDGSIDVSRRTGDGNENAISASAGVETQPKKKGSSD